MWFIDATSWRSLLLVLYSMPRSDGSLDATASINNDKIILETSAIPLSLSILNFTGFWTSSFFRH